MVDITNGKIVKHDVVANARGGTELQAELMVKHIDPDLLSKFQIIHSRIREDKLDPDLPKILVCHDLHNDPEVEKLVNKNFRSQFEKIVFVSNWQLQAYNMTLGIPYREAAVIHNAIEPFNTQELLEKKKFHGPIRIIYHTTPHRGLNILVPVFEKLAEIHDNIELDVYSSFSIYGWDQRDKPYEELFERCRNHPRIRYHGAVSNEEVREALKTSHIFAYPSIWPETSAISVIEAMSAMNYVVCPNYAALPETCSNFAAMYQWSEDIHEHANSFANTLNNVIIGIKNGGSDTTLNHFLIKQHEYFDNFYGYHRAKQEWETLLRGVLAKKS